MANQVSVKTIFKITGALVVALILLIVCCNTLGFNKNGEYVTIQDLSGNMHAKMTSGPYGKFLGHTDTYRAVITVAFGTNEGGNQSAEAPAVTVIFNDGTRAEIPALLRIALPCVPAQLLNIRAQFAGGYQHFVDNCVVPCGANAIKLSANLRSAREAYTTLSVMQSDIEDQLKNGTYITKSVEKWVHKSTGDSERVRMTEIVRDSIGRPMRNPTPLEELGCKVTQCIIEVPKFDAAVDSMIKMQRDQTLLTEIAKQTAIRANQDLLTAEASGKAAVMKVKYDQQQIAQIAVTAAERDTMVSFLGKKAAEYKKISLILEGEGEAEKRKLAMNADGALAVKCTTLVRLAQINADALSKYQGNICPVIMGGAGEQGGGSNAFMNWLNTQTMANMKMLGFDLESKKK